MLYFNSVIRDNPTKNPPNAVKKPDIYKSAVDAFWGRSLL